MNLTLLALGFGVLLVVGYNLYGSLVARVLGVDPTRTTPAHVVNDGVDYVPTSPFYLFAQHFSAIAAAGPIAGPILACQSFGWLPCLLWIGLGVVFIGAVHDFAALTASVRHGARSIAEIAREHLGGPAGRAMLGFIWIALIYVIVAFADITAGTFVAGSEELRATQVTFHAGGAVAAASVMYLLLAVVMGIVQRTLNPSLKVMTIVFVPATFAMAWLGTKVSTLILLDARTWRLLILAYCTLASVTPVWALLQPRGYLGGFVLYFAMAMGVVGVLLGGFDVQQPMFKTFDAGGPAGALFPFLFVTIACGACSGFHGLVCSGTTSKQVDREPHMKLVGYGAMLAEAFVALIALVTIMILPQEAARGVSPGTIYGQGIGRFLTLIIGKNRLAFATTFGSMAFSTFVFDTLDVSTRLGRYIVQELFGWKGRVGAIGATLLTIAAPAYLLGFAPAGAWAKFWTLFGASNQLLAALTLLAITVWLYRSRRPVAFTLVPMLVVLLITLWALVKLVAGSFGAGHGRIEIINGVAALAFLVLAVFLTAAGLAKVRSEGRRAGADPA